jgi:hypothetical protein
MAARVAALPSGYGRENNPVPTTCSAIGRSTVDEGGDH